jgi:hypothetical protein
MQNRIVVMTAFLWNLLKTRIGNISSIQKWKRVACFSLLAFFFAGVLFIVLTPVIVNRSLETRAMALVADDQDTATKKLGRIIAIRYGSPNADVKLRRSCNSLCMRLLLNGIADQVLMIVQDLNDKLEPTLDVVSYRMEKFSVCPLVDLPDNTVDDFQKIDDKNSERGKSAYEVMQIELASGNCLIAESARLGLAETVLSVGYLQRGRTDISAKLDAFADTLSADRITVHEKRGTDFQETYRRTGVTTFKLSRILFPTVKLRGDFQIHTVLSRYIDRKNISSSEDFDLDWTGFLISRLGLNLRLRTGFVERDTRKILEDALSKPIDVFDLQVGGVSADFFDSLVLVNEMNTKDQEIAQKLLTDLRFPVPFKASYAIFHAKGASDDYFNTIGSAMFKKLRNLAIRKEKALLLTDWSEKVRFEASWTQEVRNIGTVLGALPRETILQHQTDFEWLAKHDDIRVAGSDALPRLAEFGVEGGGILLWIADEANNFRAPGEDRWLKPHGAAIDGLCRLGAKGRELAPELYARIEAGTLTMHAGYWEIYVRILGSMGEDAKTIWTRLSPVEAKVTREEVQRIVEQVNKHSRCIL